MREEFNFGWPKNKHRCGDGCGTHWGTGDWTAEDLAAIYARMRDRSPSIFNQQQKAYLDSWETMHGPVRYEMVPIGTFSKDHEKAGQPLYGARMSGFRIPMHFQHLDWRDEA